jgi:hypothetical protein
LVKRKRLIATIIIITVVIIFTGTIIWQLSSKEPYPYRDKVTLIIENTLSKPGPVKDDLIKRGVVIFENNGASGEIKIGEIKKLIDQGVYAIDDERGILIFGPDYYLPP